MMHAQRLKWMGLALLLGVGGLLFLRWAGTPSVDVTHPFYGPAVQAVYATGTVEPSVMFPLAPRTPGRLVALYKDEGDHVSKDQVLAQLEDEDLIHSLEELKVREALAKKEYDRNSTLLKTNSVAQGLYDQSKANWESLQAQVARLRVELEFMKIKAPEEGLIIKRDGERGQFIAANQALFWMSCCAPLRLSAEVDEENIAQIQSGQAVLIRADAFPNQTFEGKIHAITPKGDPTTRTYRVRVSFDREVPLRIGMTAELNLVVYKTDKALLVPTSSLLGTQIWCVEGGQLRQKSVRIGVKGAQFTEILGGLSQEEEIVVGPSSSFREGQKVRATQISGERPAS